MARTTRGRLRKARLRNARLRNAAVGGSLLAAAVLGLLPAVPAAGVRPSGHPSDDPPASDTAALLSRLKTLYLQTESATESYDQARQLADRQRAAAETLDRRLADQRTAVAASRAEAGLIARTMYRDGGVSPYLSMLTGRTPQDFFGMDHLLDRAAAHQKDVLADLSGGQARLAGLNAQAQHALDRAQHAQSVMAARKAQVEEGLRQVEALLAGLSGTQSAQVRSLEQRDAGRAQQDFPAARPLGDPAAPRVPSAAGDRALAYAFAQLGKPYAPGGQGPAAFDSAGLTSQAWAHAGVPVPRTAREQWDRLPHVPLDQLRPGDVVLYFPGAVRSALFIGDGRVVQAPRPGGVVDVAPIGAEPVLGAVRPDAGDPPLPDRSPRPGPPQAPVPSQAPGTDLTGRYT